MENGKLGKTVEKQVDVQRHFILKNTILCSVILYVINSRFRGKHGKTVEKQDVMMENGKMEKSAWGTF